MAQNKYNNSDLPSTTGAAFTCNNVDFYTQFVTRTTSLGVQA